MGKKGKTKKTKNYNAIENKTRKIKAEVKKYEKKLQKLLNLHEEGKLRWKLDRKGQRTDLIPTKTQGIIKSSKRHNGLVAHIERLKAQVKNG
jgi:hypothetical protein